MEDLAASSMPHSHSAPLYLLYDLSGPIFPKHGLAPPPVHDDDDDGFEFATSATRRKGGAAAALRACASDVSSAAFADELLRAGALLPLSLPPRLQRRPAGCYSAGASAATSPTPSSSSMVAAGSSSRKHRGFDPFAAALEKVRRDGPVPAAAARARARSVSPPLRSAADADASSAAHKKKSGGVAARRGRKKGGVRHLVCRMVMAGAAVAPKALWPRRKDGVAYRPGLLVCLGYGV
ncbi:hypothetical protein HU200_021283 [Digitaria exilis]|uniref:Uncharacterized protein n=1 Tax=Digitaria exilis TaxID=1010633 RepID=A0A835KFQ4_9POAL|nr:hypothetical protein HU200_021283 [Digitaria exilis]CAB3472891.1 unnamed protein product [Digitaria exilis]